MEEPRDANAEFLRLYGAAQPLLRGWMLAWLRDFHLVEDVLQETSVVLWKQFGEFRPGGNFNAWALGIARNLTLKALRQTRASPRLSNPELLDAVAATVERASQDLELRRRALSDCIAKLSSDVRKVVDLYFGRLLPVAEVARQTGRSAGGVRVSLFRIRQWLAACTRKVLGSEVS